MNNNLSDHVPNLEICKKLKELGFPETLAVWSPSNWGDADSTFTVSVHDEEDMAYLEENEDIEWFPAPIFTEIIPQLKECGASNWFIEILGVGENPDYSARNLLDSIVQSWIDVKVGGGPWIAPSKITSLTG